MNTKRRIFALGFFAWMSISGSATAGERQDVVVDAGGEAVPLTVILPNGYLPEREIPYPLVLALPPGGGTREMVDAFLDNYWIEEGNRRGYILVSPAVLGTRLETEGRVVLDAVFGWIDRNLNYDPLRVTLAGQSNGGLGAFYAARTDPGRFRSIVVMPGGFGRNGDLDQLAAKPVLLLVGEMDRDWVELSTHTRDLLLLADAHPVLERVPGAGHVFPYPARALFDWIESHYPE